MADFQSKAGDFRAAGIGLLAASVDSETDTRELVERCGLTFPVSGGLDAVEVARLTGAFYEPDKKFLHATGFILKPDGSVAHAVYSTGPIGRYTAADALDLTSALAKKG